MFIPITQGLHDLPLTLIHILEFIGQNMSNFLLISLPDRILLQKLSAKPFQIIIIQSILLQFDLDVALLYSVDERPPQLQVIRSGAIETIWRGADFVAIAASLRNPSFQLRRRLILGELAPPAILFTRCSQSDRCQFPQMLVLCVAAVLVTSQVDRFQVMRCL